MTHASDIVRDFYNKLSVGPASATLDMTAPDIKWNSTWHYKVIGRGPDKVAEGLFKTLMAEWTSFALVPTEFITEGETVVSLGDFTGVHGITGKTSNARYVHVWTVRDGKIATFRQYIDSLAIEQARREGGL